MPVQIFHPFTAAKTKWVSVTVLLAILFSGCLKNQDNTGAGPKAGLSVSNFVVNGGNFTVLFDNANLLTGNLAYGTTAPAGASAYISVSPGIHALNVNLASQSLVSKNLLLDSGKKYSLFFYDTLKNNNIKTVLAADNEVVVDTIAKARFLDFVPGGDTLITVLQKDTVGLAASQTYIGNYQNPQISGFTVNLQPGTYTMQLIRKNNLLYAQQAVVLLPGKFYSFLVKGVAGGTGIYKETVVVLQHN